MKVVLTGEDEGEGDAGSCHALDDVVVRHVDGCSRMFVRVYLRSGRQGRTNAFTAQIFIDTLPQ